jgi:D-alanyl-D-alanine carboxypeptidase (penicillin-binding protein 5/6)
MTRSPLLIAPLLIALLLFAAAAGAQAPAPPPIAARAYILVDSQSGQALAESGADERFEPASLTKLMSAYVVFDALRARRLDPAKPVTVSERARQQGGSRMFLEAGSQVAPEELIRGMVVVSGNDATVALAEAVAGTEEAFVELMNRQARRMGLANTQYRNSTGMPAEGHHASARDVATLALALLRDFPERMAPYAQKEYTWNRIEQSNRNRLLWIDPSVDGLKTGFTEAAGYCLAATARKDGRRLVSVVLGAQSDASRATESLRLLNFGFQAFETRLVFRKDAPVATPEVFKGTRAAMPLGFDRDVWLTLPAGRFGDLSSQLETLQPFIAPYSRGQKAGIMKLRRGTATVAELPVVALEDVPVGGFLSRGWDTLRLLVR